MSKVQVKDVFELQMGKTPSRKNYAYWTDGTIDWVSIRDLGTYDRYVGNTKERITQLAVDESGIKPVPSNTLIMSFKLSLGKTAITTRPTYTNEAIMAFIDKGRYPFDLGFLFHQFSAKDWTAGTNMAVMGATLNKKTLSESWIELPEEDEQRRIASLFDAICGRIADARASQRALDELVKSRFVEMFGDVRTNEFNWPVRTFEELADVITDGEHATPKRQKEGIYLLSARNVKDHRLDLSDVDFIGEEEYQRIARRIVPQEDDVLISCSGTIGKCCVVPAGLKFQMVRSAALIRFSNAINPIFAEWLITSDDLQEQIGKAATQSSQANLFQRRIKKLRGIVPPLTLQQEFMAFVQQVDKLKFDTQQAIDKLQMLYDSLAQEYFGS